MKREYTKQEIVEDLSFLISERVVPYYHVNDKTYIILELKDNNIVASICSHKTDKPIDQLFYDINKYSLEQITELLLEYFKKD